MINTLKKDFLDSLNILSEIAQNSKELFKDELCRFLNNEFDLRYSFFTQESSHNKFLKLGNVGLPDFSNNEEFSIENYDNIIESAKIEGELIVECKVQLSVDTSDIKGYLISIGTQNYLFVFAFKPASTPDSFHEILPLLKYIQSLLKLWNNTNDLTLTSTKDNLITSSLYGLLKDIKTVNGLVTLISEEQISSSVSKYLIEVRKQNNTTLASLNDLLEILEFRKTTIDLESHFTIDNKFLNNILNKFDNRNIRFNNLTEDKISVIGIEKLFEKIILEIITFLSGITSDNRISVDIKESVSGKLLISFKTTTGKINKDVVENLFSPYKNKEFIKTQSGLAMVYAKQIIERFSGKLNLNLINNQFSVNISLRKKDSSYSETISRLNEINSDKENKLLVIESDPASSSLLKNYLTKWNYGADFVSTGNFALKLLSEKKYIAVIINIEQESENSLKLIQKIKNNKATRNTPVIVFSLEKEQEKIYTMGSVDYLVKPINYNYLVEILTSYKLRRNSTVLCVDDDIPTLNLVKQAIQTAGCKVIAENRPETVIEQILDKDIELAIIDLDMPILNGFDLIKEIKSIDKFEKLPIIIYTGKEDYTDDLKRIDGMFVDLLSKKSTSFDKLEETITSMINQYEEPKSPNELVDNTEGPKILMAEDYKHSQIIVTRLLKKNGFENVIVVENGQEALDICANEKIDLILMDMQMPIMNGFEATGRIRELENYATTPIIALTAFAMKGDREKCLEAGATDYIPKPIDSKEFIEKVKYYTQVNV